MDSYITYIKNNYDIFDPVDFYKHFKFTDEITGKKCLVETLETVCSFENDSPVRRWAVLQKNKNESYKHLDTTETKNHWAEVAITNVMADRLTAVENYASNAYRRVAENVQRGENSQGHRRSRRRSRKRKYATYNEGSNSSRDDKPRRKYRIHTDVNSDDEGILDEAVFDDDKWKIGPTNEYSLSDYLFEYRGCSIDSNNRQKHKQLSMARMMAMHHIFYFPKDSEVSCIRDLEDNYIDTVYEQIPQEVEDPLIKSASVDIYTEKIICLLNKSKINEAEKLQTFGSIMVQAANTDNKISMKAAEVLFDLGRYFVDNKNGIRKTWGEDSFVHQVIAPCVRNIFQGPKYGSKW
ncbi:hypothetical protein BDA99DRAFT_214883 [Phascolomyces articulosus]|uniref:Uncharacterized protein n=1 Tax=Phascolomyces articulosus TaxID=60185 RepID=A0AAD5K0J0_9FUNG|nr:hypothetical protein BDA99DRAFT_214883 [Phascolomyces articulosus]